MSSSAFKKALDSLRFDKRMTEWNINRGLLTKEELEKHLSSLPDQGNNVDLMTMTGDSDDSDQQH